MRTSPTEERVSARACSGPKRPLTRERDGSASLVLAPSLCLPDVDMRDLVPAAPEFVRVDNRFFKGERF